MLQRIQLKYKVWAQPSYGYTDEFLVWFIWLYVITWFRTTSKIIDGN